MHDELIDHGNIYMGAPVELTALANGAITHAESQRQLARSTYQSPVADRVAEGVTVFGGDGFLNLTLIEGDDGLIVYDTGETEADGERFLKHIRTVSDKPIVAIIYSHSHYVHGSRALAGDGRDVQVIGHPRVNENLALGAAGTTFAETAPLQASRGLQQFNHFVERSGANAAAGAILTFGKSGVLPVNVPVQHGQRMCVAGVELEFFTRHGSDTDDCLSVHLPQRGVVLNNILWPFFPNIYTLRGAKFRDPRDWRDGLQELRAVDCEVLVSTHARAIRGREAVRSALDHVIDALNLVLDQTLRGILRGLGPDELRGFVRLPPALASHPNLGQTYGEVSHYGPYLYQHALGWFDGDAASINPLPRMEQAQRLVAAMGGRAAVVASASGALEAREYAWAAQLLQYLYLLDPRDAEVRALKAQSLEAMGRVTPAHTVRSWYFSQARALRGEVDIPRLQFPGVRQLAMQPPGDSMTQYRVRIDPMRAGERTWALNLRFTDRPACHGWHVRRGVATFVAQPVESCDIPAIQVETSYDNWLMFFVCRRPAQEFLAEARIASGTLAQAAEFFDLFDFYPASENALIPPLRPVVG